MQSFIKKNSYAILTTLLNDDSYWIENVSMDAFWVEFKKTLDSLPKLNRLGLVFAFILISIIPPPYSFFSLMYNSQFPLRKKWLESWEQSKWLWRKSLFLGIRILIIGSALQLPQTMIHTNYQELLSEREKHSCLKIRQITDE
ncbi:MAG: hypothetical protein ACP5UA_08885 [Candidatus Hydrogenedens sp.]